MSLLITSFTSLVCITCKVYILYFIQCECNSTIFDNIVSDDIILHYDYREPITNSRRLSVDLTILHILYR